MGANDNTRNYLISLTKNETETMGMDFFVSYVKHWIENVAKLQGCIFLNEILDQCFETSINRTQFIQRYGYLADSPVSINWCYKDSSVVVELSNLIDLFDRIPIE